MAPGNRVLAGRYELLRPLAAGGMGRVWRGRDTVLQRPVAVKILRAEYTGDPTFLARFRAEAQHAAVLVHPNIASVFDYGELVEDGEHLAYLVMELVEGEPLSALLARERRLDVARTLDVVRQTAAALAAAHAAGVIHRDIKPGNVLLGSDGSVKITDFGIASSASSVPLTQTGQVVGTAHYLSPEQAEGGKASPASDVYALGTVAYECLAGRRAFEGENAVQIVLKQIREAPVPLPDDVPPAVRDLIGRAMAKDPAQRFPDGAALRDAIDGLSTGSGAAPGRADTAVLPLPSGADAITVPPTAPVPASRPERRRWLVAASLLLVALVAATGAVVGLGQDDPTPSGGGTPAATTTAAPSTSTPATAPRLIRLDPSDYVGRPYPEVEAALAGLGLTVAPQRIEQADVPDGQVTGLTPVDGLAEGATVTVSYAVAPAAPVVTPSAPAEEPTGEDGDEDEKDDDPGNGNGKGKGNRKDD